MNLETDWPNTGHLERSAAMFGWLEEQTPQKEQDISWVQLTFVAACGLLALWSVRITAVRYEWEMPKITDLMVIYQTKYLTGWEICVHWVAWEVAGGINKSQVLEWWDQGAHSPAFDASTGHGRCTARHWDSEACQCIVFLIVPHEEFEEFWGKAELPLQW